MAYGSQCEQIITERPGAEDPYQNVGPQYQCPKQADYHVTDGTGYICKAHLKAQLDDTIERRCVWELDGSYPNWKELDG